MTIAQVRAQIEDALRDKNKGLRVPQNILDLEYKYNKEFRELNAQVRDKAGMGVKRKREADTVAPKATKSKSADVAPVPKRTQGTKTKVETSTPDIVPNKKPRTKEGYNAAETAKPRTKQTAKKTTRAPEEPLTDWMDVDLKPRIPDPGPKPRTSKPQNERRHPQTPLPGWM